MTHCSACKRRLREKCVRATLGGNYANPGRAGYHDWLNHSRDCPRYGQQPDVPRRS